MSHEGLTCSNERLRSPWAGRNWEGAGEDPYLVGIAAGLSVAGIQSNGVVSRDLR
jgi:beta-glucosidase